MSQSTEGQVGVDPISQPPGRWEIHVAEPGSQLFHEAAQLEADVFSDWFDNSAADLETIYKPHQERMDLIAIVAPVGKVAGAPRHAWSKPQKPSLTFSEMSAPPFSTDPSSLVKRVGGYDKFLDVLSVAAAPWLDAEELPMASIGMMGAIGLQAQRRDLTWVVSLMDDVVSAYFAEIFNIPINRINDSPSFPYMGSPKTAPIECGIEASFRDGAGVAGPAAIEISLGDPSKVGFWVCEALRRPPSA